MKYNDEFRNIIYGGDYYPEQWLEEKKQIWPEDMKRAQEADINCFTIGTFAWSFLETEDGKYDFSWMDEILDLMYENHIKAIKIGRAHV